ncbi:MAG TPA: hypothetical protein VFL56_06595 [Solirubrobacterales bacterium]|nr:hypothetical protein [Solirubrobacterales bacterium]
MDTGRLSQGQIIAAVSAVVLLVAMFLPWIGVDAPAVPAGVPAPEGLGDDSENIWKGSSLDVYLLITAVVALVPALVAATGGVEEFSFASAATFLLGIVGVILVIVFLTIDFPDGAERKYGAFIGLAACVAIAYGGFKALQEAAAEEI